jgi:hypothetical protein
VLPETLAMTIGGQTITWSLADAGQAAGHAKPSGARQHLRRLLYRVLRALPSGERGPVLEKLSAWVETASPPHQVSARAMTPKEVQALADGGLMTIGAHTVSHQPLTALPAAAQKEQLVASKATLAEILGRPVNSFSYPHGAASVVTRQLARESGFQLACASHNDVVRPASNPFNLPRFWVPDWDGERFDRWLRGWLPGWRN